MDGAENQEGLSQAPTRHGSGVASATERTPESTTVLRLGRGKGVPPCSRAANLLHPDDDYPAAAVPVDQHRRQRSIPERPNGFHGAALRDDGHVGRGQAVRLLAAHRHKEQDSSAGATRFLSRGGERQDGDTPRRRALAPEILVVAGPALGIPAGDGDGGRAGSRPQPNPKLGRHVGILHRIIRGGLAAWQDNLLHSRRPAGGYSVRRRCVSGGGEP